MNVQTYPSIYESSATWPYSPLGQLADWTVWGLFLIEYVLTVAIGPDRVENIKRHPLNLAVIVCSFPGLPVIFGLIRIARLARFLRLLRLMTATVRAVEAIRIIVWRLSVVCVAGISALIIVAGGIVPVPLQTPQSRATISPTNGSEAKNGKIVLALLVAAIVILGAFSYHVSARPKTAGSPGCDSGADGN
jgi:hypothetical protein